VITNSKKRGGARVVPRGGKTALGQRAFCLEEAPSEGGVGATEGVGVPRGTGVDDGEYHNNEKRGTQNIAPTARGKEKKKRKKKNKRDRGATAPQLIRLG